MYPYRVTAALYASDTVHRGAPDLTPFDIMVEECSTWAISEVDLEVVHFDVHVDIHHSVNSCWRCEQGGALPTFHVLMVHVEMKCTLRVEDIHGLFVDEFGNSENSKFETRFFGFASCQRQLSSSDMVSFDKETVDLITDFAWKTKESFLRGSRIFGFDR